MTIECFLRFLILFFWGFSMILSKASLALLLFSFEMRTATATEPLYCLAKVLLRTYSRTILLLLLGLEAV